MNVQRTTPGRSTTVHHGTQGVYPVTRFPAQTLGRRDRRRDDPAVSGGERRLNTITR